MEIVRDMFDRDANVIDTHFLRSGLYESFVEEFNVVDPKDINRESTLDNDQQTEITLVDSPGLPLLEEWLDVSDHGDRHSEELDGSTPRRTTSEASNSKFFDEYLPSSDESFTGPEDSKLVDFLLEIPDGSDSSSSSRRISFLEHDEFNFEPLPKRQKSSFVESLGLETEVQINKARKSFLVEDFVNIFRRGDPEYTAMINMHLVPYCSLNKLTPELFVNRLQYGEDNMWGYEINKKSNITSNEIVRFGNNDHINFYEPRVFRFLRSHHNSKRHKREGLCSFCKPTEQDSEDNFDGLFFDLNSSGYLHHLTKQHGVFSNGSEMPLPTMIGLHPELKNNKNSYKIDHVYVAVCPICNEKVKVQDLSADNQATGNKFLAYFRHMLTHNVKKNSGKGR
ncbi:hypothetical protein OGAPHI_004425 [Ogataea philodendri]|uniref:Transcription regulator Rua1 C-terminal domain-containing protein n=1 Tax=Ogataea philodendri TaxID=1378263 RepID=A0A9P8P710_9ASCO|nr:uncharacterized protein OGAPHI_004425 [Ogataea philodendri]KAH3666236.1 hypothetical protein OGAPHI_004425 [Ogataea philodendri]